MASSKIHNPAGNLADEDDKHLSYEMGNRILRLCELMGLSLRAVEERIGVANGTLARLVSGGRAGNTTVKLIRRVAHVFGVSIDFLVDGRERKHVRPLMIGERGSSQLAFDQFQSPSGLEKSKAPTRAPRRPASPKKKPKRKVPRRP